MIFYIYIYILETDKSASFFSNGVYINVQARILSLRRFAYLLYTPRVNQAYTRIFSNRAFGHRAVRFQYSNISFVRLSFKNILLLFTLVLIWAFK